MGDEAAIQKVMDGSVWDEFCDRLKQAGRQIIEAAPEDPFDRAEGLRYLGRLTRNFLDAGIEASSAGDARITTASVKIGLDNPDYVYASARLASDAEYRLTGRMGDAHLLGIGIFSGALGSERGLIRDAYLSSDDLALEPDGSFEIAISREEKPGNWLRMGEATNTLNIRQTLMRRREQQPAELAIERLDAAPAPAPLDPASFARSLERAGQTVGAVVGQFLGWTASFEAHTHEVRPLDPKFLAVAQGDPSTSYNYSYWQIGEDEAFVVDLQPPENCSYWNLQIGNHWLESLDFMNRDTHVNQETAVRAADGSVRVVIAARDPGVPNWLDTAGHLRGALALRWVGAGEEPPLPTTRVLPLADLA